jgi:putative sugar O-methyltransferase
MRPKLKHFRHPLQTVNAAKALVAERANMARFLDRGERHFGADPRYDLESVTAGFATRQDNQNIDAAVLERICSAYIAAVKQQPSAPHTYRASGWWEQVRQGSLGPVMHALLNRDIAALRRMYVNFFRDACSTGLIGVPYGVSRASFSITNAQRRLYLIETLYRLDYWMDQTHGRFLLRDLAGPGIGNPFGVLMDGTLVEAGAEYRHYCAQRVCGQLDGGTDVVAEIGGGFGGMAYYLLRDRAGVTYLDFDVPESLALASYYLMTAFPELRFLLYGEETPTEEAIAGADVVLMPVFDLATMPAGSVDITFSSHAVSDISPEAMVEYLRHIARITRRELLCIGNNHSGRALSDRIERSGDSFRLVAARSSSWQAHKIPPADEMECLFGIDFGCRTNLNDAV